MFEIGLHNILGTVPESLKISLDDLKYACYFSVINLVKVKREKEKEIFCVRTRLSLKNVTYRL